MTSWALQSAELAKDPARLNRLARWKQCLRSCREASVETRPPPTGTGRSARRTGLHRCFPSKDREPAHSARRPKRAAVVPLSWLKSAHHGAKGLAAKLALATHRDSHEGRRRLRDRGAVE